MNPGNSSHSLFDDPLLSVDVATPVMAEPAEVEQGPSLSPLQSSLRRFLRDRRAMVSLSILLAIFFLSIIFPTIYEHIGQPLHEQVTPTYTVTISSSQYHSAEYQDYDRAQQYPSALHWLGTDDSGQDILARLLKGWQVSLFVVLGIEVQDVVLGVVFGVLAGYFGGLLDTLLSRFTDLMFAFPGILFAVLVTAIFGSLFDGIVILGVDFGLYGRAVLGSLVLGFLIWPQMARYVRGKTLQLKEQEFVVAARANGTGSLKIILRHILPNMASLIIVAATLDLAGNVGADATLSFLGLGVQPPGSGLGLMIAQYVGFIQAFGYELIWPMVGVVALVLICSFVGDGLEAAFDPREQDYGFDRRPGLRFFRRSKKSDD